MKEKIKNKIVQNFEDKDHVRIVKNVDTIMMVKKNKAISDFFNNGICPRGENGQYLHIPSCS